MKERPILFSAPMVRAILDGSKTQTRRIIKNDPYVVDYDIFMDTPTGSKKLGKAKAVYDSKHKFHVSCPYGRKGNRLWVKETARLNLGSEENVIQYRADMAIEEIQEDWFSEDPVLRRWIWGQSVKPEGWRPSILMPRKASRITLEVEAVRVERLQEISEEDAIAEGIGKPIGGCFFNYGRATRLPTGRESYRTLWESINGPGSWDANPYVWVIEFRRI